MKKELEVAAQAMKAAGKEPEDIVDLLTYLGETLMVIALWLQKNMKLTTRETTDIVMWGTYAPTVQDVVEMLRALKFEQSQIYHFIGAHHRYFLRKHGIETINDLLHAAGFKTEGIENLPLALHTAGWSLEIVMHPEMTGLIPPRDLESWQAPGNFTHIPRENVLTHTENIRYRILHDRGLGFYSREFSLRNLKKDEANEMIRLERKISEDPERARQILHMDVTKYMQGLFDIANSLRLPAFEAGLAFYHGDQHVTVVNGKPIKKVLQESLLRKTIRENYDSAQYKFLYICGLHHVDLGSYPTEVTLSDSDMFQINDDTQVSINAVQSCLRHVQEVIADDHAFFSLLLQERLPIQFILDYCFSSWTNGEKGRSFYCRKEREEEAFFQALHEAGHGVEVINNLMLKFGWSEQDRLFFFVKKLHDPDAVAIVLSTESSAA